MSLGSERSFDRCRSDEAHSLVWTIWPGVHRKLVHTGPVSNPSARWYCRPVTVRLTARPSWSRPPTWSVAGSISLTKPRLPSCQSGSVITLSASNACAGALQAALALVSFVFFVFPCPLTTSSRRSLRRGAPRRRCHRGSFRGPASRRARARSRPATRRRRARTEVPAPPGRSRRPEWSRPRG